MTTTTRMDFADVINERRSARSFLTEPMSQRDIRGVLEDAQTSPSNSNTQPWQVHIVSGELRERVSDAMLEAFDAGQQSADFTFDYGDGVHKQRSRDFGAALYQAWGIERSDVEARREVTRDNLRFFGAPHAAFLFMPVLGDGVRTAGDVGMYAQTLLLSLTARGFHGIPQTILGMYADVVRESLGISDDLKLLFGISFGTADPTAAVNDVRTPRLPLGRSVVMHGLD